MAQVWLAYRDADAYGDDHTRDLLGVWATREAAETAVAAFHAAHPLGHEWDWYRGEPPWEIPPAARQLSAWGPPSAYVHDRDTLPWPEPLERYYAEPLARAGDDNRLDYYLECWLVQEAPMP